MKYSRKTSVGDAGEFFFGYQVAKVLGWPCRLFDIDIGLDAQVEILDGNCESTGKFVAFQVKTTTGEEAHRYVGERQVEYWQALDVPVFVALVDLNAESILLHRIEKSATYEATKAGLCRIDFDVRHRFEESSGRVFRDAANSVALEAIRAHLEKVRAGADEIIEEIEVAQHSPDPDSIIDAMRSRGELRDHLLRAETLVDSTNVGVDEFLHESAALEEALGALRYAMYDMNMHLDYDDERYGDGDIKRFLEEGESVSPDFRQIYKRDEI